MNNPELYEREHKIQQKAAKTLLEKYSGLFQWNLNENVSVVDIGCGPGDTTVHLIKTFLPTNFKILHGIDKSSEMIEYSRKKFSDSKTKFDVVDIEQKLPLEFVEKFNHAISILCFQWIHDFDAAYNNVYKLLKPNSDFVFIFGAKFPLFYAYRKLAAKSKWKNYMYDVENYISPFQDDPHPDISYEKILIKYNFKNVKVFIEELSYPYNGKESIKVNMKAVNPFLNRIPEELHDEFIGEIADVIASCSVYSPGGLINVSTTLLVAYGQK